MFSPTNKKLSILEQTSVLFTLDALYMELLLLPSKAQTAPNLPKHKIVTLIEGDFSCLNSNIQITVDFVFKYRGEEKVCKLKREGNGPIDF